MAQARFQSERSFLKDSVRQQIDFSRTDQHRGLPAPPAQKPVPSGAELIVLPDGGEALHRVASRSLAECILQRSSCRRYADDALSLDELAALLWASQGVREQLNPGLALRMVPSAGARHAFETTLAIRLVEGLTPGLYRYLPFGAEGRTDSPVKPEHRLLPLGSLPDLPERAAAACLGQRFVARAAVTFFWTVIPERMEWRYDRAAHKVIAIDVGHVCQNLYLAAEAMGAGVCAIAAYDQTLCDELLGVDGEDEFTVYVASLGRRTAAKAGP